MKMTRLLLLAIMLLALAPLGSPDVKLDNLGDLNVDLAFQLALPYLLEQRLQFGDQVIFTYGPWGILLSPFTGSTMLTATLVFRVALAVCLFLGLCILADRYRQSKSHPVIWTGVLALVFLWMTGHRDCYLLFPALLVAYSRWAEASNGDAASPRFPQQYLLWIALSVLAGWAALAKFNVFVVSTVAFLLLLVEDVTHRRWPILSIWFAAALIGAWLAAGQYLTNLPIWVLRSLDLSNGYTDAMSKGWVVPYGGAQVAAYYGAALCVAATGFAAAMQHRWSMPASLSLLFSVFLCAVSIKHAMGGNQLEQSLAVLVAVLWFLSQLLITPKPHGAGHPSSPWCQVGMATALLAVLCLALAAIGTQFPIRSPKDVWADLRGNISCVERSLRGESLDRWAEVVNRSHGFWQPRTMPESETIDVYPQHTAVVINREGLHYVPRPAFLSLNSHTRALALLNARHLEGNAAPDLVLFQVLPQNRSVNHRHPATADGPSWPPLLSRYAPLDVGDDFLLLKKRPDLLRVHRRLLLEVDLQFNEPLSLPHEKLLWAEIDIERSLLGRIVHALYKSPHVLLQSHTENKETHLSQIVPELGTAGFLVSPFVQNTVAFAQLYRGEAMLNDRVDSITIISPEAFADFWKRLTLRLYSLHIVPQSA